MQQIAEAKVIRNDGSIQECRLQFAAVPPYSIRLIGIELKRNDFVAGDLFEAMVLLRKELEVEGARLLCAGARADAYPSPMLQSSSGGLRIHITKLGCHATREDIVNIFDCASPETVGTVEEQIMFHERWIKSLQKRSTNIMPMAGGPVIK